MPIILLYINLSVIIILSTVNCQVTTIKKPANLQPNTCMIPKDKAQRVKLKCIEYAQKYINSILMKNY